MKTVLSTPGQGKWIFVYLPIYTVMLFDLEQLNSAR